MITLDQAREIVGAKVWSRDDEELGEVRAWARDPRSGLPGFVGVKTGLLGHSTTWVPVLQAMFNDLRLTVPYDAALVKSAPDADLVDDERLDPEAEARLREHFGVEAEYADEPPTYPAPGDAP